MTAVIAIVCFVILQRIAELFYSKANTKQLLAEGAVEYGQSHYKYLVGMHAAWLLSLSVGVIFFEPAISWPLLIFFMLLQGVRIWIIYTLGRFWTTRIIAPVERPLIRGGLYRFFDHPNYLIVALEIVVLPLCFGFVWLALIFTILNGVMLVIRIGVENASFRKRGVQFTDE